MKRPPENQSEIALQPGQIEGKKIKKGKEVVEEIKKEEEDEDGGDRKKDDKKPKVFDKLDDEKLALDSEEVGKF